MSTISNFLLPELQLDLSLKAVEICRHSGASPVDSGMRLGKSFKIKSSRNPKHTKYTELESCSFVRHFDFQCGTNFRWPIDYRTNLWKRVYYLLWPGWISNVLFFFSIQVLGDRMKGGEMCNVNLSSGASKYIKALVLLL